jgi:hypothetical protein
MSWPSRPSPNTALASSTFRIVLLNTSVSELKSICIEVQHGNYLFTANAVVQRFFSMLALEIYEEEDKLLIPLPLLSKFLCLLVNSTVTEINCASFITMGGNLHYNNFLLEHALKNCPKISKIEFLGTSLTCSTNNSHVLPVERLKKSWSNLKSIKTPDLICDENTFKLILDNFPSIESV